MPNSTSSSALRCSSSTRTINRRGRSRYAAAINLVGRLDAGARAAGVYAASTGNHGQSVAYAGRLFATEATIFVPRGANPVKVVSMRGMGAEVVEHGADFDEARERCAEVAAERGARYVHSGDEPLLIAGVATATLEILEREPGVEAILVPIGGGSGAAGRASLRRRSARRGLRSSGSSRRRRRRRTERGGRERSSRT